MPDILERKDKVARKNHTCSYCNGTIEKGTSYEYAKLKDGGELYEWKNHKECGFIAQQLWSYIDPDEGMTEEDFQEGCMEFCKAFICLDCNKKTEDCYYCLDKIFAFLQNYDFKRIKEKNGWMYTWECVPKENQDL